MMKSLSLTLLAIAFACSMYAGPAHAQRVFIAGTGSDSNPCTFASPCRSFQHAHDVAAANGEIDVLDTAGYGTLTITKAISIVNPGGVNAGIAVASGGTGITINAPGANVSLRGLIVEGAGVGGTGIAFTAGNSLTIENCVVRNFVSSGIAIVPTTGSSKVVVSNTVVADNGGHGIYVQPPSGNPNVYAVFNRVQVYNNVGMGIGLYGNLASGGSVTGATIESVAGNNGGAAYYVLGGVPTNFYAYRSTSFANGTIAYPFGGGFRADGTGSQILVAQSNIGDDGWSNVNGGIVKSYGDNYTNGIPAPSTPNQQLF